MDERTVSFQGIVALIGLRGSGKSSVGRLLAARLNVAFLDLDLELVKDGGQAQETPGAFLERVGIEHFREVEGNTLLDRLERGGPLLIATGGGAVLRPENRELLSRLATCVWLRASPAELSRRVAAHRDLRPSLTDLGPELEMQTMAEERAPTYAETADFACETEGRSIESVVNEIFSKLPQ